ncbi:hypothetical protein Ciccas_008034, partial [Cichlidogyrus casuarinus]
MEFKNNPLFSDIEPLKQDDVEREVFRIHYTEEFAECHDYLRALMSNDERSERALLVTKQAIDLNPANYTTWDYRRNIIGSIGYDLGPEKEFISEMVMNNPKNYQVWFHRQWVLTKELEQDSSDIALTKQAKSELEFLKEIFEDDSKNYHAWQYFRWMCSKLNISPTKQLEYVGVLLVSDIYNNSAWNHRFYTVTNDEGLTPDTYEREFNFVTNVLGEKETCNNESAWHYFTGLLNVEKPFSEPSKASLLRDALQFAEKLSSDLGSDAPAPLLSFLVDTHFDLIAIDRASSEKSQEIMSKLCERLANEVDKIRVNYWNYRKLHLVNRVFPTQRYIENPFLERNDGASLPKEELSALAMSVASYCVTNAPNRRDMSIYTGGMGSYWALWHVASRLPDNDQQKGSFLATVHRSFKQCVQQLIHSKTSNEDKHSFICGNLGIYTCAACVGKAMNDLELVNLCLREIINSATYFGQNVDIYSFGSDEMFVGRAGVLIAFATLRAFHIDIKPHNEVIKHLCSLIILSGSQYSIATRHKCPLMFQYHGTQYLGAAHGVVGIIYALLLFWDLWREEHGGESARMVRETVDILLDRYTSDDGNLIPATGDRVPQPGSDRELIHWCHGASGAIILYAKAFRVWNDAKYLKACEACANLIWRRGFLKKGPGICHGVAGSGYAFLLMHRLTGEQVWLDRAIAFAALQQQPSISKQQRQPDHPLSLYEGSAGTACFYADCSKPSEHDATGLQMNAEEARRLALHYSKLCYDQSKPSATRKFGIYTGFAG